jgi:hypothetical protein
VALSSLTPTIVDAGVTVAKPVAPTKASQIPHLATWSTTRKMPRLSETPEKQVALFSGLGAIWPFPIISFLSQPLKAAQNDNRFDRLHGGRKPSCILRRLTDKENIL